ncbi:MAG: RidA family protein [Pseudomonas sp.]
MPALHFGQSHVPLSPAVRAGDFVFVSGQVPVDASGRLVRGDVQAQTRQVIENLAAALALAGCRLDQVVKTLVVLTDAGDFTAFNQAYREYFPTLPPARTTLAAQLMIDAKVEIEAIAYAPQD